MTTTLERPADSAGDLYFKTDVSPDVVFQAIGGLRKAARDEIDRLIRFLDKTDDYVSRELEDDGDQADASYPESGSKVCSPMEDDEEDDEPEDTGDKEPSLGFLERHCLGYGFGRDHTGCQDSSLICAGRGKDLEDEHDGAEPENEGGEAVKEDDEPSLGWTVDGCMEQLQGHDRWGNVVCDLEAECA